MKLKNTTDYPDYMLRRCVAWCCRQLGLPVKRVTLMIYRNRSHSYGGHCHVASGEITVSVRKELIWSIREATDRERQAMVANGHSYADMVTIVGNTPGCYTQQHYAERADAPAKLERLRADYSTARLNDLVRVTAHELAHRWLYLQGTRTRKSRRYGTVSGGGSEQQTVWFENEVMKAFKADRDALLAKWSAAPQPAPPHPSPRGRNATRLRRRTPLPGGNGN